MMGDKINRKKDKYKKVAKNLDIAGKLIKLRNKIEK